MELRYYQEEAVEALFEFYSKPRELDANGKPVRKNALLCLPTGTGKSIIIGEFLHRACKRIPTTRAIMSTHVKELIKQNAAKLQEIWPLAPLGIFSAGLKSRDIAQPIIFGGVQSMAGKFPLFGFRDFLIIDEAHLVGNDGSYLTLINELQQVNPFLKIIGLTATRYRMGLGCLTNGKIFTDIVYDKCTIEGFNRLIAEGFLCPLIPKKTATTLDVSNVGFSRGDFIAGELEKAVDKDEVTLAALTELVSEGHDRQSWLIFASGVEHANHIGTMLNEMFGVPTVVIHSKKTEAENEKALAAWKSGEVRAAVNMNSLTTGVDNPMCDLIGMLRPTMSTGLWVQMLGRGTRPFPGKPNCKVLDFAGNTRRLGPINDPVIPRLKGKGPPGEAPVRICPQCNTYNHATARVCIACDYEFPKKVGISESAGTDVLLRSDIPQIEAFAVDRVVYTPHVSKLSGKPSIKASYYCGLRTFYYWFSVEGIAGRIRGRNFVRQHYGEPPETNIEALQLSSQFRIPRSINVWVNKKNPEVMSHEF